MFCIPESMMISGMHDDAMLGYFCARWGLITAVTIQKPKSTEKKGAEADTVISWAHCIIVKFSKKMSLKKCLFRGK